MKMQIRTFYILARNLILGLNINSIPGSNVAWMIKK